jgi:hypothetical protein
MGNRPVLSGICILSVLLAKPPIELIGKSPRYGLGFPPPSSLDLTRHHHLSTPWHVDILIVLVTGAIFSILLCFASVDLGFSALPELVLLHNNRGCM